MFTDFRPAFFLNGKSGHSSRETSFALSRQEDIAAVVAILSSDVFWWWYTLSSNLRDLNPYDIQHFPIPKQAVSDQTLQSLGRRYIEDIDRKSTMHVRRQRQTGVTETQQFKIQESKDIINEIDHILARHYGFTDEELDFIINYDRDYTLDLTTRS